MDRSVQRRRGTPMKTVHFLTCAVVVLASAGCSSKSDSSGSPVTTDAGHDAGDPADAGDPPEAAPTPEAGSPAGAACKTSGDCAASAPCCAVIDGGAQCTADSQYAEACLCQKGSECGTSVCAPSVDSSGNPTAPYVCKTDNGSPYYGCISPESCSPPYCCVTDKNGNQFCAAPCTGDSTCGSGHCDSFDFSASTCTGVSKACGI